MERNNELSWISQYILKTAFKQLKDADYEENAEIQIGRDFVLINEDEFEELKSDIINFTHVDEEIVETNFNDIVKEE